MLMIVILNWYPPAAGIQDIYCDSKRWWRLMASTTRDCIIGFANTIPQTESSLSFSGLLYPINQMDPFYPLSHFIISSMYEILHKILKILKRKIKKTMKYWPGRLRTWVCSVVWKTGHLLEHWTPWTHFSIQMFSHDISDYIYYHIATSMVCCMGFMSYMSCEISLPCF